jgi:hypothetical protein
MVGSNVCKNGLQEWLVRMVGRNIKCVIIVVGSDGSYVEWLVGMIDCSNWLVGLNGCLGFPHHGSGTSPWQVVAQPWPAGSRTTLSMLARQKYHLIYAYSYSRCRYSAFNMMLSQDFISASELSQLIWLEASRFYILSISTFPFLSEKLTDRLMQLTSYYCSKKQCMASR